MQSCFFFFFLSSFQHRKTKHNVPPAHSSREARIRNASRRGKGGGAQQWAICSAADGRSNGGRGEGSRLCKPRCPGPGPLTGQAQRRASRISPPTIGCPAIAAQNYCLLRWCAAQRKRAVCTRVMPFLYCQLTRLKVHSGRLFLQLFRLLHRKLNQMNSHRSSCERQVHPVRMFCVHIHVYIQIF